LKNLLRHSGALSRLDRESEPGTQRLRCGGQSRWVPVSIRDETADGTGMTIEIFPDSNAPTGGLPPALQNQSP
jgi:hypothetical protein